jgi:hypothetical protein
VQRAAGHVQTTARADTQGGETAAADTTQSTSERWLGTSTGVPVVKMLREESTVRKSLVRQEATVAAAGWRGMAAGKSVVVPDLL